MHVRRTRAAASGGRPRPRCPVASSGASLIAAVNSATAAWIGSGTRPPAGRAGSRRAARGRRRKPRPAGPVQGEQVLPPLDDVLGALEPPDAAKTTDGPESADPESSMVRPPPRRRRRRPGTGRDRCPAAVVRVELYLEDTEVPVVPLGRSSRNSPTGRPVLSRSRAASVGSPSQPRSRWPGRPGRQTGDGGVDPAGSLGDSDSSRHVAGVEVVAVSQASVTCSGKRGDRPDAASEERSSRCGQVGPARTRPTRLTSNGAGGSRPAHRRRRASRRASSNRAT